MAYNLEQLGPTGFQDLAAALAVAFFGPGVQVMGPGRDGGRDMHFKGALTWRTANGEPAEVWDGYTIFQVKHKRALTARPDDNAGWLWGQIRDELEAWANPASRRNPVPDYMIVVSNVPLTPAPGSGGHDLLQHNIEQYIAKFSDDSRDINKAARELREKQWARLSRIKKWRFWDGNQLQGLLSTQAAVRRAFPGFFTAADVFANLNEFTDKLPLAELEPGLRAHARSTLTGESLIYFDEAGSRTISGFPVHEVAVDLPVTVSDGRKRSSAIGYVLDRAEHMLKPRITTQPRPHHLVVTGAPGNGKTTLSKFLVQIFRAAMLDGASALSSDQRAVIDGTREALRRFGRELPQHRRWAMRIDLAEYAQEGGLNTDSTLLKWVAHKVSRRSDAGSVSASALQSWMKQWPWFLALDGLDEVTEQSIRKRLIQQITEFVNEAEAENCDVLVVLTTRPVGYTEYIAPTQFEQIDLDYLDLQEAVRYGTLATRVRLGRDTDRVEKVVRHLRAAAEDETLQNLLRTPLQVLILTIIIDGTGQLSPDRYSLFWNYYETVFKREREKIGGLHRLLREYAQQVQQLHERVGFELQARSEAGDRSYATLSYDELRDITWSLLKDGDFKPSGTDAGLLEDILAAATQRLVLIAPRGDEGYGFDVRSLQELTAAMYVTTGPLDAVTERLRRAASSPHWRNTWIFAAGRLFSTPQTYQHKAIVELIESVDANAHERLGSTVPIGPRLALEIIDDGMARSLPRWRNRLMSHGLRVLLEPTPTDLPSIARILVRYADTGQEQANAVAEGIRDALEGREAAGKTAEALQKLIPAVVDEAGAGLGAKALSRALMRPNARRMPEAANGWEDFEAELLTSPMADSATAIVMSAGKALRRIAHADTPADQTVSTVLAALPNPAAAAVLEAALSHVIEHEPTLLINLRNVVLPVTYRQPIGESLRP